jgi:hypothetical protein
MLDSLPVEASPFRAAVESGDHQAMIATLAEDVRLFSPAVHAPYVGRPQVGALLGIVFEVFEDFGYTSQLVDGPDEVLRFTARVGNRDIEGVDLIHSDTHGRVTELTVMIRPLSALLAVRDAIDARLGADR